MIPNRIPKRRNINGIVGKDVISYQIKPPIQEIIIAIKKEGPDIPNTARKRDDRSKKLPFLNEANNPVNIPTTRAKPIATRASIAVPGKLSPMISETLLPF